MINKLIGVPLGYLMWLCYRLIPNYGLAIILFTLLTKIILLPLSLWVQKNSIKMIKLQPEVNLITAKYAGSPELASEEQLALYKREKYKPLAGIVPMLIQIPLILGLINVIYNPLEHLMHISPEIISAFTQKTMELLHVTELGSSPQLKIVELINDPALLGQFRALTVGTQNVGAAIDTILSFDLNFLGMNLASIPNFGTPLLLLVPFFSALSAFMLCWCQNQANVLQLEQNWLGRWGVAIFLTAFSGYFAMIVPCGVGIYWIIGNVLAIAVLYLCNAIYNPKKYIDYEALEKSKHVLAESKKAAKAAKPTPEQKARAKADYKRFFALEEEDKQLVFYSEKSGFYKYMKNVIEELLRRGVTIHYITSDPNDAIFSKNDPHLLPYYIDDNRLITLFMKMDCDVMVMTTPDLNTYYLKRSLVKKDIEYIFMWHGMTSTTLVDRKGAYDAFDTLFCCGPHHIVEIRESEQIYGLPEKKLIEFGYGLIEELIEDYEKMPKIPHEKPQILIAPSHQDDCIIDICLDELMVPLIERGYKVILRAHPQYIKRNPGRMEAIAKKYENYSEDELFVENDFSSNESIYQSDILITDWSGIAHEFAFATKKPAIFIDTPMKILNPDYQLYKSVPIDISLRNEIGVSVKVEELGRIADIVAELLAHGDVYAEKIDQALHHYIFNLGTSAAVGADYIESALAAAKARHAEELL